MQRVLSLFFMLLRIYLIVGFVLYIFQRDLLYHPTAPQAHNYNTVFYQSDNEMIEVNIVNPKQDKAILYFGGNAESVIGNAPAFSFLFPHHSIYLINYRGYSKSSGSPSEEGLFNDALEIYAQIKQQYSSISVIGRSLGSGVATYLASQYPIDKLILITPFDSILNVAQSRYPIYPISILLKDHYNSLSRVKDIDAKTLILVADNDRIITSQSTNNLIDVFRPDQLLVKVIANTNHNSISYNPNYSQSLKDFINHAENQ